jgi:dephospho-CoA kinase
MRILGLTGSIGMGKSTIAGMLRRLRIPVYDADAAVHRLMAPGGAAFATLAKAFPDCMAEGRIDRIRLGNVVFADDAQLARLEAILHPLVARDRAGFLRRCRRAGNPLAVLDIPLLFEKGLEHEADAILVVSAPAFLQRQRVLVRPGMTKAKFAAIRGRQVPDAEKRRRGDFVIVNGLSRAATLRRLQTVLKRLDSFHARNRPRYRNHGRRPPDRAPHR